MKAEISRQETASSLNEIVVTGYTAQRKKEITGSVSVVSVKDLKSIPAGTAEQMLQHKEIIKCIQQLTPAYKAVFNLYVIEGFSHAEIAEKLNISEGSSKSNLFKARQNLQQNERELPIGLHLPDSRERFLLALDG